MYEPDLLVFLRQKIYTLLLFKINISSRNELPWPGFIFAWMVNYQISNT